MHGASAVGFFVRKIDGKGEHREKGTIVRHILAHDVGTSGNKATLYTEFGQQVASVTVGYPSQFFNGTWAEQNPDDWWRAVCDSTQALLQQAAIDPRDIEVVALSGQMMGCTPVDAQGRALRPSILYCDQRAIQQESQLRATFDPQWFYGVCGHRISASYTLEKLMWIRDNEPEVFKKTYKTLCAKDYINCRLTGKMVTDFSDASGTNAFDLQTFTWSPEILAGAGLPEHLFPDVVESTRLIGAVTAAAARETGLLEGTPVAAGGGDGSAAGVGVGCVEPGSAYNCLGSSSWIALTVRKPIVDPEMRTMNWAHCVPGYLHPSGTMQTAGSSFKWLSEQLGVHEGSYAKIDEVIASVPIGAHGVFFLPYMLGERTPWWNSQARGAFIGLNLASTRADMMRAVMEGVAMNLSYIKAIFEAHVPIETLTVIGGGSQSAIWRRILADACGCTLHTLNSKADATSLGAAIIGGVAAGIFKDFSVTKEILRVEECVQPDARATAFYVRRRAVMMKAYQALVEVYSDLANEQGVEYV